MFYDRVDSDLTLDTVRFNGVNQQQLIIDRPDFYPLVPPFSSLSVSLSTDGPCIRSESPSAIHDSNRNQC